MKKLFSLCLIFVLALGASSTVDAKVTHKKKTRVTTQKTYRKKSQPATPKANNSVTSQVSQSKPEYNFDHCYENKPKGVYSLAINYEKPENSNLTKAFKNAEAKFK
jgi:hypothetical protein